MTNTHTKGPWTINIVNDHNIQIRAPKAGTQYECSVAILGGWDTSKEDNQANARLIAAAPDLLESLKIAMSFVQKDNMNKWIVEAMAAIAKAEGK